MEFPTCSLSGNKSFRDNLANNWRLSISSVESLVCVSNDRGVCVCVIRVGMQLMWKLYPLIYKWLHRLITGMSLTHAGTNEDFI